MKMKIVLLLVVMVGSAALVASAQQATPYVITRDVRGDTPEEATKNLSIARQQGPTPKFDQVFPRGSYSTTVYGVGHPTMWNLSAEENGLSQRAEQLTQQLAVAKSDSDREKIKGLLSETLEKQFDQRQKRHEEELKELEAQVKKLKDLVDKRQENRRDIIRARLAQIEKEAQGLGW